MGPVKVDRSAPVGIFIMAFGCLFLFVVFFGPGKQYRWQKKMAKDGIRATAEVKALDRKWTSVSGAEKRQYFYTIEYTFQTESGRTVTGSDSLMEDKWAELGAGVGSTIQVIYDKDDPQSGHPVGWGQGKTEGYLMLILVTFGILAIALGIAIVIRSAIKPIQPDARASRP